MKNLSLLFLLCCIQPLFAQQLNIDRSSTYAVVVGISDYQDEDIPDLSYADKDATAFANYLRSPAGGALDDDHLKLLTNEQATLGQLDAALWWLVDESKKGDRVIIYFSGHGDVERRALSQPGFLLCWDAPAHAYTGGGTYSLFFLKSIVETLSIQSGVKVTVITDACRSGKLAGSAIGGAQATAANLVNQYANEIKILSCQPDEYSIEGEQWGGGRGAFSYHLLNGLYGMADANADMSINLKELGRYLEDHVTEEVAPQNQNPMTIGSNAEQLASVIPELLAQLNEEQKVQMPQFNLISSKGIEDEVIAATDTSIQMLYAAFQQTLKDKVFLFPEGACADAYYKQLIQEPQLEKLHNSMRRKYAAALQDDAQQAINGWLKTDIKEAMSFGTNKRLPQKIFNEKVKAFPRCLDRAAELLGKDHYMYMPLQARKHFFEGYLLANASRNPDHEIGMEALAKFRQALQWQADFPLAYWQMSLVFAYQLLQPDSMEQYSLQAMELHPTWQLPYLRLAYLFTDKYRQYDRANYYLEQAERIDSSSSYLWNVWGIYYKWRKEYTKAEQAYKKAIQIDSTYRSPYINLGMVYRNTSRFDEAEKYLKKAIQIDSTYAFAYNNLGNIYFSTQRYDQAEQAYKKAIQIDSTYANAYNNLGSVYFLTRHYDQAEQAYKKAIQIDSTYANAYSNLACLNSIQGKIDFAFDYLEKALRNGEEYGWLNKDKDLSPLREQTDRWNTLMKKYFPEQVKE